MWKGNTGETSRKPNPTTKPTWSERETRPELGTLAVGVEQARVRSPVGSVFLVHIFAGVFLYSKTKVGKT